jgi:hypothetical protein
MHANAHVDLLISVLASPKSQTSQPGHLDIGRILTVIACLTFVVGYYAWRWKQAGEMAAALAREEADVRCWHQALLSHPAWGQLHAFLASQGVHVVAGPPGPGQVEVRLLTLNDAAAVVVGPGDPRAVSLNAYCRGEQKLVATLWLNARYPPTVCQVGPFGWPHLAG